MGALSRDRTSEWHEIVKQIQVRNGKHVPTRFFKRERKEEGAFLILAGRTSVSLRAFRSLLGQTEDWFLDFRHYGFSNADRDAFEKQSQEVMFHLLESLSTLRRLADASGAIDVEQHILRHRQIVTDSLFHGMESVKRYLTHMQQERMMACLPDRTTAWAEEQAFKSTERSTNVNRRPGLGASATRSDGMGNVDQRVGTSVSGSQLMQQIQPPVWTVESELRRRDIESKKLEKGIVEVSQLLQEFSIELAKQSTTIETLFDQVGTSHSMVSNAQTELERMRPSVDRFRWFTVGFIVFMALSLLLLEFSR